jgi:hypothetical protein
VDNSHAVRYITDHTAIFRRDGNGVEFEYIGIFTGALSVLEQPPRTDGVTRTSEQGTKPQPLMWLTYRRGDRIYTKYAGDKTLHTLDAVDPEAPMDAIDDQGCPDAMRVNSVRQFMTQLPELTPALLVRPPPNETVHPAQPSGRHGLFGSFPLGPADGSDTVTPPPRRSHQRKRRADADDRSPSVSPSDMPSWNGAQRSSKRLANVASTRLREEAVAEKRRTAEETAERDRAAGVLRELADDEIRKRSAADAEVQQLRAANATLRQARAAAAPPRAAAAPPRAAAANPGVKRSHHKKRARRDDDSEDSGEENRSPPRKQYPEFDTGTVMARLDTLQDLLNKAKKDEM